MSNFSAIVNQWPTATALADDVGIRPVTARAWRSRNSIPSGMWLRVVAAAKLRGFAGVTVERLSVLAAERAAELGGGRVGPESKRTG